MAVSEFGALTREFYIVEIGTWKNYGGKRVWWFIEGRYKEVLLYLFQRLPTIPPPPPPVREDMSEAENEALCSMLMSWYMSGYHTGYYQVSIA